MFYAWYGIAHYLAGLPKASYEYLCKGIEFGEETDDQKVGKGPINRTFTTDENSAMVISILKRMSCEG